MNITVWSEFRQAKTDEEVKKIYPKGINYAIKTFLSKEPDMDVTLAYLDDPSHGLTDEVLSKTDVLIWWGHIAHNEVEDSIVNKVHERVLRGMGLIVLHSGHLAKIFTRLLGTSCSLKWREEGENERLWIVNPNHPIVKGIEGDYIDIEHEEMYGEHFDVPAPDDLIFISWFKGGEVFRSGLCYRRGAGKIFYFRPGHETFPIYFQENIQTVIKNAVRWANPDKIYNKSTCPNTKPIEKI